MLFKKFNLKNRNAIITGASGHLGSTFANTLAEMGCNLILVDKDRKGLIKKKKKLNKFRVFCDIYETDLESEDSRKILVNNLKKNYKQINILINSAAFVGTTNLQGWNTSFEKQNIETWRRAVEVNLTSIFDLCKGLSFKMKKSLNPSIINIISTYGIYGPDWKIYGNTKMGNPAAYAASKGGLLQLTRWLATTLAPKIRVNSITPGGIFRNQNMSFVKKYEAKTPLNRMATEDDFIGAIALLASDNSLYMTGENIIIDGGWGVW